MFTFFTFIAFFTSVYFISSFSFLHLYCLEQSQIETWKFAQEAIVCAKALPRDSFYESLKTTGLLHLIVVSGSHLVFLESILRMLKIPNKLILLLLLIYGITCLWDPPVYRAFIYYFLLSTSLKNKFPNLYLQLSSLILGLIIRPELIDSLSLQLSAYCSLILAWPQSSFLKKSIGIYVFLFPILIGIGHANPWSIVINLILAPLISFLLFPLNFAAIFFKVLSPVTDQLWQSTNEALEILNRILDPPLILDFYISSFYRWLLYGILFCYFVYSRIRNERKHLFSNSIIASS